MVINKYCTSTFPISTKSIIIYMGAVGAGMHLIFMSFYCGGNKLNNYSIIQQIDIFLSKWLVIDVILCKVGLPFLSFGANPVKLE